MITHRRNESAPAGLEVPTGATPHDVRGDGRPLRATYDGPGTLRNAREVAYVALDSGQLTTHLLRRSEVAPVQLPAPDVDVHRAKILAYDADASDAENEQAATLVLSCCIASGTAKVVPLLVMRAVMRRLQREEERVRQLEDKVRRLEVDNETLLKRGRR